MVHGKPKQVDNMNEKEQKTLLETRLRNLKRKYSRLKEHPDFIEECIELKAEIDGIQRELQYL